MEVEILYVFGRNASQCAKKSSKYFEQNQNRKEARVAYNNADVCDQGGSFQLF